MIGIAAVYAHFSRPADALQICGAGSGKCVPDGPIQAVRGGVGFPRGAALGRKIAMLKDQQVTALLPAADLARARDVYRDKLGLEPENPDAADNLRYKCGSATGFLLYQTPNAGSAKN